MATITLSSTLGILTAMFTPAVLVSACGSLILTTSQRLSRSLDRQREVAGLLHQPSPPPEALPKAHLLAQLHFAARRAQLLQQVMTMLHLALGMFVGTVFTIGLFELTNSSAAWVIALLSVVGASLLLYASLLLIRESRLAVADVREETQFLLGQG
ncbi:DUF2721 domain-containing protein [Hymenobacter sp. RP-2-7]|uniref:DUF2721 domain-containing protein n=1 Tax=Hymenobacter polaris TaxID=2682546 RepID=A0A7Y0AI29_9BACT|nr:DUF2721 domain-containing protein [Hymenobacter polaris]NML67674.1 DUF2721 domain-containing protein [Hymenobacter polaris]